MGNCCGSPTQVVCHELPPPPKYDRKEIYDNLTTILRESYDWINGLQQTFAKIMGNCCGSPTQVVCHELPPPPKYDRKEIYDNLTTILRESYDWINGLQQTFTNKVIQSPRMIKAVRKKVEKELRKSKKTKLLSEKKAEEIVNDIQKENDWLKRSLAIVTNVITKLKDAREDDPSFIDKQPNYKKLIDKLKTDVMTLIKSRIKQIKNQPSCAFVEAESSDDSETNGPSDHANSGNDSSHSLECVSENESNYGVETVDKSNRYQRQVHDYKLLYECTLILKTVRDDFSKKIYSIIEGAMCQANI